MVTDTTVQEPTATLAEEVAYRAVHSARVTVGRINTPGLHFPSLSIRA